MDYMIDLAGVGGAIVLSIGLALCLEWMALRGLMRLMPAKPVAAVPQVVAAKAVNGRYSRYSGSKAA
jgi:uncharacterized membrane protein YqgA involved in biofilm formation